MCGIFAYLGNREAISLVLDGLEVLEYRGYDSAGLATICNDELRYCKEVGKVSNLQRAMSANRWTSHIAIAHTRWATHGIPNSTNAHPHFDEQFRCAVVHNGIIENYSEVKEWLAIRNIEFRTDTDSESIAQLIGFFYDGNFVEALQKTCRMLKGSFAFAAIHRDHPDELICSAKESPLIIGIGDEEVFVSSDLNAFAKHTKRMLVLKSSEVAVIGNKGVVTYDQFFNPISKEIREIKVTDNSFGKGAFRHYMLKEIFEQPLVLQKLLDKYLDRHSSIFALSDDFLPGIDLKDVKRIRIIGCGSSYHSGLLASYFYETSAKLPVCVETSSEFLYRNPYIDQEDFVILISQSGETADTLAVLKKLRCSGVSHILGLCNVETSSLAMEVDFCLFLEAGPEIGVASTKAFTSQLINLILFGLKLSSVRGLLSPEELHDWLADLARIPELCQSLIEEPQLEAIAKKYASHDHFFFLGRSLMYPVALEGALKLKEIAYVNANGYPAGEMKHGPIALVGRGTPIFAFCGDERVYEKTVSNLMEVNCRGGKILLIGPQAEKPSYADDQICIPKTKSVHSTILYTVVGQLLAYYIALERGTDIDCPRNLAKSVTVE